MDDINLEIVKLIENPVDKIHYLMAFRDIRYLEWCGDILNYACHNKNIDWFDYVRLDGPIFIYLFSYMNVNTINILLTKRVWYDHRWLSDGSGNMPLEFIKLAVKKYDKELCWKSISAQPNLSNRFIRIHSHKLSWLELTRYTPNLSLSLFERHIRNSSTANAICGCTSEIQKKWEWNSLVKHNNNLTTAFIEKYNEHVNWNELYQNERTNFPNKWRLHKCKYFILLRPLSKRLMIKYFKQLFVPLINEAIERLNCQDFHCLNGYEVSLYVL
jgi:hypothetical protein